MAKSKKQKTTEDEVKPFRDTDRPYEIVTPADPERPVTWRYDRLKYLLDKEPQQQVFIDGVDDLGLRYAYLFCQQWAASKTPEERLLVKKRYPGLAEAFQIYQYQSVEKTGLLEGYILADCAAADIGGKFSLLPDTVNWYEQLFFDARTRLSSPLFIETSVIQSVYDVRRLTYQRQKVEHKLAAAYKSFGYHGGIIALELVSTGFLSSDAKPIHRETAVTFIQNAVSLLVGNQGTLLTKSGQARTKCELGLVKMAVSLAIKAQREGKLEVIQNVSKALESVTPLIGADVKTSIQQMLERNPEAAKLLQSSVELRAHDQIQFDRGAMTPEQMNQIAQLTYQPAGNNHES